MKMCIRDRAMTAQEKAFVEDLWNTDPAKASEYWAAGEFLDTEVPKQKISAGQPFDESTDFYIAPNGKILAREYKNWIGTNMRDTIIKKIEDKMCIRDRRRLEPPFVF